MKKVILFIAIGLLFTGAASAQILPDFQFGIKAGANLSSFPASGAYNNSDKAGYLGGIWARFGALGFNFQPELYVANKDVNVTYTEGNSTYTNKAQFTSVDLPLLLGTKMGAFGFGARFYTGPVISFAINRQQNFGDAASAAVRLNYSDQNYAWQFGGGLDIQKLSIDLRYEAGLNKIAYGNVDTQHTRINLFNLTLAYQLFSM